jgi:hypothetical protein
VRPAYFNFFYLSIKCQTILLVNGEALQLNGLTNQIRIKSVSGSSSGIVKSEPHSVSVLVVCLSKALPTQWKHVGSNPARVCLSGLDFFVKSF